MARNLNSRCKQCRRSGEKLFLKGERCYTPKCALTRKNYAPGMHGKKMVRGLSEYGKQLAMKQKIKRVYGVMERQFRKHFSEIENRQGVAGDLLMIRLETRLDNVVYRLGLANSRAAARQLVNHNFIRVNDKKVTIPSYEVKIKDVISINKTKQEKSYVKSIAKELKSKNDIPAWLNLNVAKKEGKILSQPALEDIAGDIKPQLVVEYYSR